MRKESFLTHKPWFWGVAIGGSIGILVIIGLIIYFFYEEKEKHLNSLVVN